MTWEPDYVTLQQMRDQLKITAGYTDDDALLTTMIGAASRAIDREAGRQFGKVAAAEERIYPARSSGGRWVVDVDDVQDVTGLTVENGDGDPITGYRLWPRNAAARGRPYERLILDIDSAVIPVWPDHELTVTAVWGWTAVPDGIEAAARLQTSRFFARRESPYGVAGSPDLGSELRLLAKVDADVAVMVRTFERARRVR